MRRYRSLLLGVTLGVGGLTACSVTTDGATDDAPGEELDTPSQERASTEGGSTSSNKTPENLDPVLGKLTSKVATPNLLKTLAAKQSQLVLVELDTKLGVKVEGKRGKALKSYKAAADKIVAKLDGRAKVKEVLEHVPMFFVELSSREVLRNVLEQPGVVRVYEDEARYAQAARGAAPTNIDTQAWAQIKTDLIDSTEDGAGIVIANLDTGIDYTVNSTIFGDCSGGAGTGTCRVSANVESGTNDNVLDNGTNGTADSSDHGTFVGAILATVAPAASILSYDVFSGSSSSSATVISAINAAVSAGADVINIEVASATPQTTACGGAPEASAINTALSADIVVVAPTGNAGSKTGVAVPACVPGVLAVGAVYDGHTDVTAPVDWLSGTPSWNKKSCTDDTANADDVICISNNSSTLTSLLAPGWITSTLGNNEFGGTSAAAPWVAAAAAVLRGENAGETRQMIAYRMTGTGTAVVDDGYGTTTANISKPRLDLSAALNPTCVALVSAPSNQLDSSGKLNFTAAGLSPTGADVVTMTITSSCAITGVSAGSATHFDVGTLTPSGTNPDANGNYQYTVEVTSDATAGTSTLQSGTITLAAAGTPLAQSLTVTMAGDTTAPTGSIALAGGAQFTNLSTGLAVALTATDSSGYTTYCLSETNSAASCTTETSFSASTATTYTFTDTTPGTKTVYAFLRDRAGNVRTVSASVFLDQVAPNSGTVTVTAGLTSATVNATGLTDPTSGGAAGSQVAFADVYRYTSTTPSCGSGTPDFANVAVTGGALEVDDEGPLAAGTYSYLVCAKDKAGNFAAGAAGSVTITGDILAPVIDTALSGIVGTVPSSVGDGTGSSLQYTTSTTVNVRIVATDPANVGGDPNNAVSHYCLSLTAFSEACTLSSGGTWRGTFSTNSAGNPGEANELGVSLLGAVASIADGTKTIYYKVVDTGGNTTSGSFSTKLDRTKPTGGTFTVGAGNAKINLSFNGMSSLAPMEYRIVKSSGASKAADCTAAFATNPSTLPATLAADGTRTRSHIASWSVGATLPTSAVPYVDTDVTNATATVETRYYYRLCGRDAAGNVSDGTTTANAGIGGSAIPRAETGKPSVSTFTFGPFVNSATRTISGVTYTYTNDGKPASSMASPDPIPFTLTGSANGGTLAAYCVRTDPYPSRCTWNTYSGSSYTHLFTGSGAKTAYAWLKDDSGNYSVNKKGTVRLDWWGPKASTTFTVTKGTSTNHRVTLSWTAMIDDGVGLATSGTYEVHRAKGKTAPASSVCGTSTNLVTTQSTRTFVMDTTTNTPAGGIASKDYYSFRICAKDKLGNWGTGATRLVQAP